MKIKALFGQHWFLVAIVFFLLSVLSTSFIYSGWWAEASTQRVFVKLSVLYFLLITVFWAIANRKILFSNHWVRNLIIITASVVLVLWTYKHPLAYKLNLLLLLLCGIEVAVQRKYHKSNAIIITFLAFLLLRFIGVLWFPNTAYALQGLGVDMMLMLVMTTLLTLGFRVTTAETDTFVTIVFRLFLALLTLNTAIYILYTSLNHIPLFSFFTLNKNYMHYVEVLIWSEFKHPSLITWLFLLAGGLAFLVHKKSKKLISTPEMIIYGVLLIANSLMLQARVTIVGIVITLIFFIWLHISRQWSVRKKVTLSLVTIVMMLIPLVYILRNTSYFVDSTRVEMIQRAIEQIKQKPILGWGTMAQKQLVEDLGHLHPHNDFVATTVDLGIVGLALFLLWFYFIIRTALRTGNTAMLYTTIMFVLIMNTDVIFNSHACWIGGLVLIPVLTMIFFAQKSTPTPTTEL